MVKKRRRDTAIAIAMGVEAEVEIEGVVVEVVEVVVEVVIDGVHTVVVVEVEGDGIEKEQMKKVIFGPGKNVPRHDLRNVP